MSGDAARASLASVREDIESIDAEIVRLLARRVALARETGALKRDADLPILDPEREAAVMRRVTELASAAGLPPEAVGELFSRIVDLSRSAQEPTEQGRSG